MKEEDLERIAKAVLEKLLTGGDVIEVKKVDETCWRIRLLPPSG
jgi:hypothetical protein